MQRRIAVLFAVIAIACPAFAIDNTPADGGGTIATGGVSQTVFAANPNRRYLFIQNHSVETLQINFGAAASAGNTSYFIVAGGAYESPPNYVPTTSVTIIGATTGSAFTAKQGGF
jgi:hypothetical protein